MIFSADLVSRIPKKWKWSGDLFIGTSENKTELLCAVTIADPSGTGITSHINLLLSSLDSLRISKLYPIMDLHPLLRACGKPQYFGRLESNEPSDEVIIQGLEYHLTSEGLVGFLNFFLFSISLTSAFRLQQFHCFLMVLKWQSLLSFLEPNRV